ncbi:MAG: peptidase M28 [Acidobacteria bacterium]|nr:MAG: peptidase M28 [Acidobacteriota bacterium]
MPICPRFLRLAVIFSISCSTAWTQDSSNWTVKPEWVRAHERFLASDAMRGRGSATPDEWIAATYVASEFEKYGLKPGLPDGTYIQRAELVQPVIDGPAQISAPQNTGFIALEEGKDFSFLRTSGDSISGPLQKINSENIAVAQIQAGAIVMLAGDLGKQGSSFLRRAYGAGAKAILREDASLNVDTLQRNRRERRPVSPHLPDTEQSLGGGKFSVLAITKDAADRLGKLADGTALSLRINTKDTARYTYNAVGVLPGTDASGNAKIVLLSAHLDHLGIGQPVNGDSIYNGANDDASGTSAVLELAHALASGAKPQRTIYFVCYGSEEFGGLGSTYFREHSPVPLDRIAANLEFEMIGNQDPKMPKGKLLFTGWNRSNLGPTLVQHGALLGDDPYPEQHFFERSDNYSLALKGVVAQTAGGWGTPPTYHKPDDDIDHLDFDFMTQAIQSLVEPVRWLANSDFVPQWLPGKEPLGRE